MWNSHHGATSVRVALSLHRQSFLLYYLLKCCRGSFYTPASLSITSIVVSRFFFNLRQVNELPEENRESMPRWSSIHFSPNIILGNLSAPLCFQEDDEGSAENESLEFATEDTDESESTARYHTTRVDEASPCMFVLEVV